MPGFDYHALFDSLCLEAGLVCRLSFDMPKGYEEANGMYDPETDTVFVNAALLKECPDSEKAFYLFHELRHAEQYAHPERFPPAIRKALDYDIAYDGNCSKRANGQWVSCRLDGGEDRFTRLYLSQPHEIDANQFAYAKAKTLFGGDEALENLRSFWIPSVIVSIEEYDAIYSEIDEALIGLKD